MKLGNREILAIAIAAIFLSTAYTYVVFQPPAEEDLVFSGEVTGLSSYNQPKLDLEAKEIFDAGLSLGSTFTVITETEVFESAILLKSYLGMFMFDIFVNVEKDGTVSIGCVGKLISAEVGSTVQLVYSGVSERYMSTPLYNENYSNDVKDYPSEAVFANFYEVTGGEIAPGIIYRSFSSLNSTEKDSRSSYVNALAEEVGIEYLIALSYSDKSVKDAITKAEGYCIDLCKGGNYIAPSMGYLYFQQKEKDTQVLRAMIDNDGPYLIHCNVGRDRSGFVVLLLQALCGCTAEEMQECEARALCNLYNIEYGSKEYNTVVSCTYDRNLYLIANPDKIDDIFNIDWDNIDVSGVDTFGAAYTFCTEYLGWIIPRSIT